MGKKIKTSKRSLETRIREEKAVKLRLRGLAYKDIGDAIGTSESTAWKSVNRVLERTLKATAEDAQALREIEARRLDALIDALWDKALDGDVPSALAVLKIQERRSKMLGLDKQVEVESNAHERILEVLRLASSRVDESRMLTEPVKDAVFVEVDDELES